MRDIRGVVKSVENVAIDTVKLEISSDLEKIAAGQFISILCPPKTLRRPFSASSFKDGVLSVLFKVKGDGTKYLKSLKKGDSIDFLAPLGNGFNIVNKKSLLVGAGIGIAPMLFLKETLNAKGIDNYLITGFKSKEEIIEGSDENVIGGSVLDNLEDLIKSYKPQVIYSCGPEIVLRLVSQIGIDYNIPTYLALEHVMACGIGVCRGCVIDVVDGETIKKASICKDGPVFEGDKIVWQ